MNYISLGQSIEQMQNGKIGVIPTDTVYGVVARASDTIAVKKLYSLKNRHKKPGTLIAADIQQLIDLGIKPRYLRAVSQYWPGAVTVVLPTDNLTLRYLDQGVGTLAVRVVDNKQIADLLKMTGPLITSSANIPGEPVANNIMQALDYFNNGVDFYVDGGDLSDRQASTIIRILDDVVDVLRQGAVTIK
ncbi:threonylcarbamoyl-AMP synthase [Candidatus Saccharibacteria bacterium]|nr:threonylcarbamoyl-AMP synthase [Candidatus Saccharibacteria bacterium]